MKKMKQKGQAILVLILVMTVALSIGLSIVQKSLVDISTSTKVEQSSKAFSAAEAGIERALVSGSSQQFSLPDATVSVLDSGLLPPVATSPDRQQALEIGSLESPLTKDEVGQVWLADPAADLPTCTAPAICYDPSPNRELDVYWGDSSQDKAALLLSLIYWDGSAFQTRKWYIDHSSATRNPSNGFDTVLCSGNYSLAGYQCYKKLGDSSGLNNGPLPTGLMVLRARLLYNTNAQPFAVQAVGNCGPACSIPPQLRILTSTGLSGNTQRRIQLSQLSKIIAPFFDYAIFSAGDISK